MTKLEKMLQYVSEHNDFYKQRIKDYGITNPLDITQWPILTRKELQENRYNMFSDGYKSKYFNQQLRRQSSSGSTGMPVNVYWDYKDWYASNMCLWRKRMDLYGIRPSDKQVSFDMEGFYQIAGKELFFYNRQKSILSFNISVPRKITDYYEMVEIINQYDPAWIRLRPFALELLLHIYANHDTTPPHSLRLIETYGELLNPYTKERASSFFGVPIADMYGSEELNCISYDNNHGIKNVLSGNVYVEVLNNKIISKYGEGESIITSLLNYSMPLIRYNQGDFIMIDNKDKNDVLNIIHGRTIDCVFNDSAIIINPLILLEIMGQTNNYFGSVITYYKFNIFKHDNIIECIISLDKSAMSWSSNIKKYILNTLVLRLSKSNEYKYKVSIINEMPPLPAKNRIVEVFE